jgi:hypothetical protein
MKTFLAVGMLSFGLLGGYAQDMHFQNRHTNHFSFGVTASDFSFDSGLGIEVTSPRVLRKAVCFRFKGSMNWMEQYKATYDHWAKYSTLAASVVVYSDFFERVRWYVDVGPFIIIPESRISDRKYIEGGSGIVGLEIFVINTPHTNICYYFGVGAAHCTAYADKLEARPRYGNGIIITNGFRFYF